MPPVHCLGVFIPVAIGLEPAHASPVLVFGRRAGGDPVFAVLIANLVTQEGESNWFEGVQLMALYAVLGLVFYFALARASAALRRCA